MICLGAGWRPPQKIKSKTSHNSYVRCLEGYAREKMRADARIMTKTKHACASSSRVWYLFAAWCCVLCWAMFRRIGNVSLHKPWASFSHTGSTGNQWLLTGVFKIKRPPLLRHDMYIYKEVREHISKYLLQYFPLIKFYLIAFSPSLRRRNDPTEYQ